MGGTVVNKVALIQTATDDTTIDRVVISMTDDAAAHPLVVVVNGETVTTNTTTPATGLKVEFLTDNIVKVTSPEENSVAVSANLDLKQLSMGAVFADSCKGKTRGLIGNYNGDPTDDLVTRHGHTIDPDSSEDKIYHAVVKSYLITDARDSIFPSDDFMPGDVNYTPHFVNDTDMDTCEATSGCPIPLERHCCLEFLVGGSSFVQEYNRLKLKAEDAIANQPTNTSDFDSDVSASTTPNYLAIITVAALVALFK